MVNTTSPRQRKYLTRLYCNTVVRPTIHAREQAWLDREHRAMSRNAPCGIRVADVCLKDWPAKSVQAWCQLKLQGYFTAGVSAASPPSRCFLCGHAGLPSVDHLLCLCPVFLPSCHHALAQFGWDSLAPTERLQRFQMLPQHRDVEASVTISSVLLNHWRAAEKL